MLYKIAEMKRPEVEQLLDKTPALILPVGATEQHGPHLPMGMDSFIAEYMAWKVGGALDIGVLPVFAYSYCWVWHNVKGSAYLSQKLLEDSFVDISLHYSNQGLKYLIFINGHGANEASLKYACRRIQESGCNLKVLYFTLPGIDNILPKIMESQMWNNMMHACEVETSMGLAIRPDLVDMSKAVAEYPLVSPLYGTSDMCLGDMSKTGVFGDATKGTAEKGVKVLDASINSIIETVKLALKG